MTKRIQVDWKLDPLALVALVLSFGAAIAQLWAWWGGSSVRFLTPDRVALYSDVAPDGSIIVRVAAHMSYANVAQGPYGDLVTNESLQLRVGSLTTTQQWNALGTITRDGPKMTELAAPQPLPGQSAATHFTLFSPMKWECSEEVYDCDPKRDYLPPELFVSRLGSADKLQLRFTITTIDGDTLAASCHVPLTEEARALIANVRTSYAYLYCYPDRRP